MLKSKNAPLYFLVFLICSPFVPAACADGAPSTANTGPAPLDKIPLPPSVSGPFTFSRTSNGLIVNFPRTKPCDDAYVLKITGLRIAE